MNLVVDEAVEVYEPTKERPEGRRRELGMRIRISHLIAPAIATQWRSTPTQSSMD